jgi:excisionase family DNA binding protein
MTAIFVSREVAADALSISVVTLDRLTKAGQLRASKIGRRVLYAERDLQQFADRSRKESK